MAVIRTVSTTVYPSELDIAEVAGEGNIGTETNVSNLHQFTRPKNHIIADRDGDGIPLSTAGFIVTDDAAPSLNINITKGECWIDGYRFIFSAELIDDATGFSRFLVAASPNTHNYVFININKDGSGRVTNADLILSSVTSTTAFTYPSESVIIALVITDATKIVEVRDLRPSAFSEPTYIPLNKKGTGLSSKVSLYVPWYGKFTTLKVLFATGNDSGLVAPAGKLTITGPIDSVSGPVVTAATPTTVGAAKDIRALSIDIDNSKVGRFGDEFTVTETLDRGGYLDLQIELTAGGTGGVMETFPVDLSGKDMRACARFMEWNSIN